MSKPNLPVLTWRTLMLIMAFVMQHTLAIAQLKNVTGTIRDEKGNALPGATILVKDTKKGIVSNADGTFSLYAGDAPTTLVISMTGFAPLTVTATPGVPFNAVLKENAKELNEVMVVGYGTQKKSSLTGSVAQISSAELKKTPAMNLTNMLAGRLPGLVATQTSGRPGFDDASLLIRGQGTYNNNSPVVIVDGVQRSFANLDPSEVESISILKDAAAAATYGVQGANGVILVTTKRGASGKPVVSYDGEVTRTAFTRFPKFLNGPDYMYWLKKGEQMDNDYLTATGGDPIPYTYSDAQIAALRNGTNKDPFLGNTDWTGMLTGRKTMAQHHSVSVRGGSDKVRYFSNASYLDQEGVVKGSDYKRYNVRTNLDANINKVFSVALDLGARQETRNSTGIPADDGEYMNPFYQAVRALPNIPATYNDLPTATRSNSGIVNPIAAIDNSGWQRYITSTFQGAITFTAHIPYVKGLDLKLMAAYDKSFQEFRGWTAPYTLMVREQGSTGWYWNQSTPPGITINSIRQSQANNSRQTFQPSINYSTEIGQHSIKALALYEYSRRDNNGFSAGGANLPLTELKEIDFRDQDNKYIVQPTGNSGTNARAGLVTRINYAYKNKYLLELVSRYDGSVYFPTYNRWGFFPAASAAWVISEEGFFSELKEKVDFLKLRASYGKLGNDQGYSDYQYLQTFSLSSKPVMVVGDKAVSGIYSGAIPNTQLTWEKAYNTNVGVDATFFHGGLSVSAEYFYKLTKDILDLQGNLFPPSMGGYYPQVVNRGMADVRGFDLQLTHRHKVNGRFDYAVTGNLNWSRNKILVKNDPDGLPAWQRSPGRSIGEKKGFISEGLFQSWEEVTNWASSPSGGAAPGFIKYKDINGDGKITTDDITYMGRSNIPQLMYGLNLEVRYGIFDFSALIQGAALRDVSLGGEYEGSSGTWGVNDNTPFTRPFYGGGNSPYYLVEQAWTPDNPNARYPRLTADRAGFPNHNGWANSQWVRNGAYVRLKSAQLGVTLPASVLRALNVEKCRFYLAGFNLLTFDHLKYMDPEMPNANNGFYPQQQMMSFGANLTF
nr:TonB-dependent receptor [uncultured Chitinophaga sp.]